MDSKISELDAPMKALSDQFGRAEAGVVETANGINEVLELLNTMPGVLRPVTKPYEMPELGRLDSVISDLSDHNLPGDVRGRNSVRKPFAIFIAFVIIFISAFSYAYCEMESEEEAYEMLRFLYPTASYFIDKDYPLIYVYEVQDDGTARIIYASSVYGRDIPVPDSIDGIPVTVIGTNAYVHTSRNDLAIPEGIREIESQAFYVLDGGYRICLPATLEKAGDFPFYDEMGFEGEIVVDENNPHFAIQENCLVDLADGRLIQHFGGEKADTFRIPDGIRIIGENAFTDAQINHFILPEGVIEIRKEAFPNCAEIDLPASLTTVAPYFTWGADCIQLAPGSSCFSLENGVLFDRGKTRLIYVTSECADIEYHVPEGVRIIDDYAFRNASAEKVYFPSSVEQFSAAAFSHLHRKSLIFEANPQWYIQKDGIIYSADGSRLIYCSRDLETESVTIPEGVREIGPYAFANTGLKHIELPATIEKIGDAAFAFCGTLEEVIIPDAALSFGDYVFLGCLSLRKLIIPKETTHLGKGMFRADENNLTVYVYPGTYAESFMKYELYLESVYWDRSIRTKVLPLD